jgi:hypothetical protein
MELNPNLTIHPTLVSPEAVSTDVNIVPIPATEPEAM